MRKFGFLLLIVLVNAELLLSQDTIIPLWPKEVPNRISGDEQELHEKGRIHKISFVQHPSIAVYLPSPANRTGEAVLIFPGGGYHILAYDWEGTDIAKFLNSRGIAGIVVKYRLPVSKTITRNHEVPLQDAQRAIRMVRAKALDWGIDPNKIGVMGFSAGGHLASTLGTHFDQKVYSPKDQYDTLSARPDFMALVYPVITFSAEASHQGSKKALLGPSPSEDLVLHYSSELQVTSHTPPTLLIHAADDEGVPVANSLLFFEALLSKDVSASLHIYPRGGHGFSLAPKDTLLRSWTDRFLDWLGEQR